PLVHRALLDDAARGDAVIAEVVLHDTDRSRVRAIEAVRAAQAERSPAVLSVRAEPDRRAALRGAGMVFSAMRVGGLPGRVLDERVALEAGVIGQETVGAGGISYGLRTLPVALAAARDIAEAAPQAWTVNFTNPAGLVTEAMAGVLGERVLGKIGRASCRARGWMPGLGA